MTDRRYDRIVGRMRVLSVIDSLVPGGAETSLAVLAPHVAPQGIELHVAQLHDRPGLQSVLAAAGVELHDLSARPGRLGWTVAVRRLVLQLRPDLVHTTLYEADVAGRVGARSAGVPVVSTLATERYGPTHLSMPHLSTTKIRAAQALDIATARLTARLHAVSTPVADVMARHLRYDRQRIDVVGRAREPVERVDDERRRSIRSGLGVRSDEFVVLAVARHDHVKGLDLLVDAVGRLRGEGRPVVLWIAGRDGPASADLRRVVAELGIDAEVQFLGHRDDVSELLGSTDVFVLPSRREGAPGALLEAMAAGAAVVAVDLPTVREIVDDDSALLVPPERADTMASGIATLLDDPAAAARRADTALRLFGTLHSPEVIAAQTRAFYERALGPA